MLHQQFFVLLFVFFFRTSGYWVKIECESRVDWDGSIGQTLGHCQQKLTGYILTIGFANIW